MSVGSNLRFDRDGVDKMRVEVLGGWIFVHDC